MSAKTLKDREEEIFGKYRVYKNVKRQTRREQSAKRRAKKG